MAINTAEKGSLESRSDFKETPSGQYRYWQQELASSDAQLRNFRNLGTKIVTRYLGGSRGTREYESEGGRGSNFRLNLLHSNVITLQSMLYVELPKVTVKRRFDDANDDAGRVASMIMQRLLTNDLADNGKEYSCTFKAVLQDRLLPGLGVARVRYEVETEQDPMTGEERVTFEDAPCDYYHWRDVAWGWGRTFADLPWIGFRTWMKKDDVAARFGDEVAEKVDLKNESVVTNKQEEATEADEDGAWRKAEIWEIWDKTTRRIVWVSPGYDKVLDTRDDTLQLSGFFPCPPFLVANQTTSLYIPTADFVLAQDLYNEVDVLQTRISIITEAVKVVGVYNRESGDISRMFSEGTDNDLIPVDNWAMFAEKGGIAGQIDWVPIDAITEALLRLRELRDEAIGLLQQVTGMSDIMRGELGGQYEGVGQSQLKAKFGSVRVQALQDDLANFASDLLQLKAEIISRHFDPETIARRANVESTFDTELIPQAIALIKDPDAARLRVAVKPESVGMADYSQLKQERTELMGAMANFLVSIGPVLEVEPGAKPFFLEMMKWSLAGFKGSDSIESVFDKMIEMSNQAAIADAQNPDKEMDDKAKADKAKTEGQIQLEQLKHQNTMQQIQAKVQADIQLRQSDLEADIQTKQAEYQLKADERIADMQAELAQIEAKMVADIKVEMSQSQINAQQQDAAAQSEVVKSGAVAQMDIVKMEAEAALAAQEAEHQAKLDIQVAKAAPKPEKPKSD